jgi:hypothetical protein
MSSRSDSLYIAGLKTGAALTSSDVGKVVKLDASGDVVLAGAGETGIGILSGIVGSGTGAAASVVGFGGAIAIAGGAINEGDFLKADASGELVATTTDNDFYIGRAIVAAADGDQFHVFVNTGFYGA